MNFYVILDFYLYYPTLNFHQSRFASANLKKTQNRALIDAWSLDPHHSATHVTRIQFMGYVYWSADNLNRNCA